MLQEKRKYDESKETMERLKKQWKEQRKYDKNREIMKVYIGENREILEKQRNNEEN